MLIIQIGNGFAQDKGQKPLRTQISLGAAPCLPINCDLDFLG